MAVTHIKGYAALFGSRYDMGSYWEEVAPGAFDGADMTDIKCLFNHDINILLGRSTSKTLEVRVDNMGLYFRCLLPPTENGRDTGEGAKRADITQASWGFSIAKDGQRWSIAEDGRELRTITKIKRVYDVSPVTFPANPDTMVFYEEKTTTRSAAPAEFTTTSTTATSSDFISQQQAAAELTYWEQRMKMRKQIREAEARIEKQREEYAWINSPEYARRERLINSHMAKIERNYPGTFPELSQNKH